MFRAWQVNVGMLASETYHAPYWVYIISVHVIFHLVKSVMLISILFSLRFNDIKWNSNKLHDRYKHLNAEFQRIARRDKKAFLSDQCKEIEENNRMGKTRDLVKKIRDTNRIFHAKMGSIKDRNGMDLTEADDIKKKWQEYTEDCTKKNFMTKIITMVWSLT